MGIFKDLIIADTLNPKYKDLASNSLSLLTNDTVLDKAIFEQYKNQKRIIDRKYVNTYYITDCDESPSINKKHITDSTDSYKLNSYENQIKDTTDTINSNNTKLKSIINRLSIVGGNSFNCNYILCTILIFIILYIILELFIFNNCDDATRKTK